MEISFLCQDPFVSLPQNAFFKVGLCYFTFLVSAPILFKRCLLIT